MLPLVPNDVKSLYWAIREIGEAGPGLLNRFHLDRAIRGLRNQIEMVEQDVIVLSHEMILGFHSGTMFNTRFENGPERAIRALRSVFRSHSIHWVLYVRDSERQKKSAYNQNVKVRNVTESYNDWERKNCPPGMFETLIGTLKSELANELTVIDFDAERACDRLWGYPVLELAGLDATSAGRLNVPPPTNESLPANLLDLKRRANAAGLTKRQGRLMMKLLEEAYGVRDEIAGPSNAQNDA